MLSIIICTYNRDKYIYGALKSIAENNFSPDDYEIVLVNNNSTDHTESECKKFQNDFPSVNFRYFVERQQGLSHARNRGIEESQGGVVAYVDDDATVNKEYLQAIADFFGANPDAHAAGGPVTPVYETCEPKWMSHFTKNLITGYKYEGKNVVELKHGKYPGGGNAAYRREVFEKVGLFNPELGRKGSSLTGAEEKDIFDKMRSLGMKFYYLPNMVLYHIIPANKLTPDYFNRLTYSIGQSERIRTLKIARLKYAKRLTAEVVKWAAAVLLFFKYTLLFSPQKGKKLLVFRWNVTKGLLFR